MTKAQELANGLNKLVGGTAFWVEGDVTDSGREAFTVGVIDNREESSVMAHLRYAQDMTRRCGFSTRINKRGVFSSLRLTSTKAAVVA